MPDHYAVIGNPIAHSKSPQIHAAFARQTGEPIAYDHLYAPLDGFETAVGTFAQRGGLGLNVTMPFKEQAYALCRDLAPRAKLAGAVNTLSRRDGTWHGDNTDGAGIVRDLTVNLGVALAGRSVLILGAGGAARGVTGPLLEQQPRRVCIANRTVSRAEAIVRVFEHGGRLLACSPRDIDGPFDVVINATPWDDGTDVAAWPRTMFAPGAVAYDMVYADAPTAFLRWARTHGAERAVDGLGMLIEQAAESFLIWRGVRPDTRPVFDLLRPGRR